ncbi:trissin receptor-like [Limulus polyphemus]|uniref:Trissin receptor-like n=1 Tax=Limulus polyphemus TaxID=6850 RepID=A0ABM1B787_LIMPO|nr:trissin receptor-like [Limulus polyphemus]
MEGVVFANLGDENSTEVNNTNFRHNMSLEVNSIFSKAERAALIVAYTFVFFCCVFGNLLIMIVVFLHRRLRTVTNFFLINLAVADLCVGVFCVFQNLSLYLMNSWPFGNFLCKMYHFIQSLTYTASITILMIICIERYMAIVHPLWSKHAVTLKRLRVVIAFVWLICAVYCCPRLIIYGTAEIPSPSGTTIECFLQRRYYDSEVYDIVNFVFLLIVPLVIIIILYTIIGIRLWRGKQCLSQAPRTIINARRKVVRLLLAVVLSFALCNLPFHARKLWQYWSPNFNGGTKESVFITIGTTLLLYFNSGINPILYAFLSNNFRNSMKDVLCCRKYQNTSRFTSYRSNARNAQRQQRSSIVQIG